MEIRQDAVGQSVSLDDIARVARYVERELTSHEELHLFMSLGVYESLKVDKDVKDITAVSSAKRGRKEMRQT